MTSYSSLNTSASSPLPPPPGKLQSWKKKLEHLMHIITTILISPFTIEIGQGGQMFNKKQSSLLYQFSSRMLELGDLAQFLTIWIKINIALGWGYTLSLNRTKCILVNRFLFFSPWLQCVDIVIVASKLLLWFSLTISNVFCVCAFVKCVNRGYIYTQYTSTGDAPAIGDIPSSKKALNLSKRECTNTPRGS